MADLGQDQRAARLRRLSREGLWIVASQVAVVAGSLVGVRLLTKLLDPATYGELALGMTIATLLGQTVIGPLSNGVTRFYAPAMERGVLGVYLHAVRRLLAKTGWILIGVTLAAVVGLRAVGRSGWTPFVVVTLIFALGSGFNAILSGIQIAARQRSIVALHQGVEPWARFLTAGALVWWLGSNSTIAMLGYAIAVVPVLASQLYFLRRIIPPAPRMPAEEGRWQDQILGYSWPFAAWGVFTWLQLASDRWALSAFATADEVGLYAVLYQLGYYPISLATGMATQFLTPILFQRAGDASDPHRAAGVHRLGWRLTGLALAITGVAVVLTWLLHVPVFRLLVAPNYRSVSYLLPWMTLAGGTFAAGQAMSLNLMSQLKTQEMILPKIATAGLGVAFNVLGAYWLGTPGIVIAAILFSVIYLAWMAILSRQAGAGLAAMAPPR